MYNISHKYALSDSRLLYSYVKIVLCIACVYIYSVSCALNKWTNNTQTEIRGHGEFLRKFQVCSAPSFCNCNAFNSTGNMVPGFHPAPSKLFGSVQHIRIFDNNIPHTHSSTINFKSGSREYLYTRPNIRIDIIISLLQTANSLSVCNNYRYKTKQL